MTLHSVTLPALDGRDPLGFLAALGLLRLLTEDLGQEVRLSFSDTTAQAVIYSPFPDTRAVAHTLSTMVTAMPDGAIIPGVPPGFPMAKAGTKGSDPFRVPRERFRTLVSDVDSCFGADAVRWLTALVTDLGCDNQGRAGLTPYCAPSGQQTIRSYFEKPFIAVRDTPALLLEALTQWRRVPGTTGEYLDHRVLQSAADHPRGELAEMGVPGATWLAIMALPLLRLCGDGTTTTATLWRRAPKLPPTMLWPIWRQPLDLAAVTTLIEHPDIPATIHRGHVTANPATWPALGIITVSAAQRRHVEGRKNAGVLTPVPVHLRQPRPTPPR